MLYEHSLIYLLFIFKFNSVYYIVAIFYPFSQFCEIDVSLLSLQTQPNTAPNLFLRGVEYGKYDDVFAENIYWFRV